MHVFDLFSTLSNKAEGKQPSFVLMDVSPNQIQDHEMHNDANWLFIISRNWSSAKCVNHTPTQNSMTPDIGVYVEHGGV